MTPFVSHFQSVLTYSSISSFYYIVNMSSPSNPISLPSSSIDILSTSFPIGNICPMHRIVLAPMTRMRASDLGVPHPLTAEYYAQRTTPGGLLISEGTVIHPRGKGFPNTPGIWDHEQIEAWKTVTETVHEKGGYIFCQIWHVGRVSVPSQLDGRRPIASTTTPLPGKHQLFGEANAEESYVESEALDQSGINEVIEQFAIAATNAMSADFDGVEIHGGNGYLLDTFVHDNINTRTDIYGGSIANRLRFPLQVVDAVISAIGASRTAIRIAPFHVLQETKDSNRMKTFTEYTRELEKRGLAYVHIVEPRYDQLSTEGAFSGNLKRDNICIGVSEEMAVDKKRNEAEAKEKQVTDKKEDRKDEADFSLWPFRRILKTTPLISAGGHDAQSARFAIQDGRADFVAFGRYFTSNPDLVKRIVEGLPLTKYDRKTFYTPELEGWVDWKVYGAL